MSAPAHSYWSASKFESLMLCPGKVVLEQGAPDSTSAYAAEGTAAHQVLTWAINEGLPASAYIGRIIMVEEFSFEVDEEMAEHVQTCLDYVEACKGPDGIVFADIRVNYSTFLDVEHHTAWGTADVIVSRDDELVVIDYKHGRGVEVEAERNPQMSLYALGALQAYQGVCADFTRVRMAISQPRVRKAPSEWDCSVEELEAWAVEEARRAVTMCRAAASNPEYNPEGWAKSYLRPAEKACKFCKAKATCPALREEIAVTLQGAATLPMSVDEFDNIAPVEPGATTSADFLSVALSKVDLIEDWCKAIRTEAERRLFAGEEVPGYKVVAGKKGARAWDKSVDVEALLKTMRLKDDEMYDRKVISPTTAEKLAKAGTIGPRQWGKLQEVITQSEGKPHVAPLSDSRPALEIKPVADDFEKLA